jgi:hypothetical protein
MELISILKSVLLLWDNKSRYFKDGNEMSRGFLSEESPTYVLSSVASSKECLLLAGATSAMGNVRDFRAERKEEELV